MSEILDINLNYLPVINFAMQQNNVPVIREIIIRNTRSESIGNIDICVNFEPEFAKGFCTHIDSIAPGAQERISEVPVSISTEFLANLTERISGRIIVTATSGNVVNISENSSSGNGISADTGECNVVLAEKVNEISLLTFNEWSGSGIMPEILAAFSTPNHPEINLIKKRASEILGEWTGNPSLNAYQNRSHNRVKYQMAAIFEAIAQKGITYCVAPSSFESNGQRIRTADELMSLKMGNCMDMTMLYAGCLESIGLHPLVILTEEHAFAGCWLVPDSFPDSYNDDPSLITKRMAEGMNEILVVECTAMNDGSNINFDTACDLAKDTLLTALSFSFFLDICRARVSKIRPLPIRTINENGKYIIEEEDQDRTNAAPSEMSATDLVIDTDAQVNKKTIWERKLLDLSLRNNLLNLRLTKGTIHFISANINEFENALANNEDFKICPKPSDWDCGIQNEGIYRQLNATDAIYDLIQQELQQNRIRTYLDEAHLKTSLTHLYRSAKVSMEENGANTLYLALGLLKWFETPTSQKPRYAPILLVPVEIVRKSAASGYILRSRDEDTMLNITLLELLRQMFNINIGGLDPLPKDSSGVNTSLVFNTFRRKIMEQKNWDILEQAILGNFSFNKFIMWNDIHNSADILCQSPIVSSLMNGVVEEGINAEICEEGDLDQKFGAEDIILPISADSSQIEAITAALSGKSFILHGPPGTGKSQTITNIIANALYRGKKVLFVAEKMAALEVVQNRLNSIGLSPFCLELHSNKAKKSNVLEQLKRTTEVAKTKSPDEYRIEAENINSVRNEMNSIIKALHKQYPLGLSLYDCISRYVSISEETPSFNITATKAAMATSDNAARMKIALNDLQAALKITGNPSEHPLKGIGTTEYNVQIEETLARLPEIIASINTLENKLSELYKTVAGTSVEITSIKDCNFMLKISNAVPCESIHISILTEPESIREAIESTIETGIMRDSIYRKFTGKYDTSLLQIDTKAYETEWREILSKGLIGRFFAKRKFMRKLGTYCSEPVGEENVLDLLKEIALFQKSDAMIATLAQENKTFRNAIAGYETDWEKIKVSCNFAGEIRRIVSSFTSVPEHKETIVQNLANVLSGGNNEPFFTITGEHKAIINNLQSVFEILSANFDNPYEHLFDKIKDMLSLWYWGKDKIRTWILYNKNKAKVVSMGFAEIAQQIDSGEFEPDIIHDAYHKALYKAYAEYILTNEPELQLFHGKLFEEKIKQFRWLCSEFEDLTKQELFARVASALPALQKEASQSSEVGILQRNIRNGCRGTSLRNFFTSIQDLLHRMCPCMLMSPISVAQYIKAEGMKFDLVIFDEASQMPTCEAVGTIARGNNIIVVGDPKQLPPTNFFNSNTFDEENAHLEDLESILDDCLALTLPSKHLRWHYRSRHESLIAFSNRKYYDNKLHTFPSPDDLQTKIDYQHVEGEYDRGGSRQNKAEAQAIINEIKERLSDPQLSKLSIGVVTFNSNQQSLLEDMLNEMFITNPHLEKIAMESNEPIFIKNLENVQGDERDIILFSIGYGQDKNGKITLNFGPLNRDGGWRRLNVAVSRARYGMKVFSTLRSEQIDLKRTTAEGVAGLKEFLEYAEKGEYTAATSNHIYKDGFVEKVAEVLRSKGYDVKTNIGSSGYRIDIGIVNPSDQTSYIMGILCDGYNYNSSRTARDREIVQIGTLRRLGWKICRIWTMDWWSDKDAVIKEICSKIEAAIAGKYIDESDNKGKRTRGTSKHSESAKKRESLKNSDNAASHKNIEVIPYNFANLQQIPMGTDVFMDAKTTKIIKAYIKAVIGTEAPVQHDLLCKRVLKSLNISRMTPKIAVRMQEIIESINPKTTKDINNIYWMDSQDPHNYPYIRETAERDSLQIPFIEAKNASVYILKEQGAQPLESLVKEMAKLFGYSRIGDNVSMIMKKGIEMAASQSLIDISNNEKITLKNLHQE